MIARRLRPIDLALTCGALSVVLGLTYLFAAGAPRRYLVINASALVIGVVLAMALRRVPLRSRTAVGAVTVTIGLLLLGTAFFGVVVDGASRWIVIAGITLQPAAILVPLAVGLLARSRDALSALGVTIAALALALQPDRAMAGALLAGVAALWMVRRERPVLIALLAAVAGFAATLLASDTVPPVPFVEQVVRASFAHHPLLGLLVVAGLAVMLVPAAIGIARPGPIGDAGRDACLVAGATWLAVAAFSMIGNYPTPLVGYGSSAILGYCLHTIVLDRETRPLDARRAT